MYMIISGEHYNVLVEHANFMSGVGVNAACQIGIYNLINNSQHDCRKNVYNASMLFFMCMLKYILNMNAGQYLSLYVGLINDGLTNTAFRRVDTFKNHSRALLFIS